MSITRTIDVDDLIKRLKSFEPASRVIDSEIHLVVSKDRLHPYLEATAIDDDHSSGRPYSIPNYTRSFDQSLELARSDEEAYDIVTEAMAEMRSKGWIRSDGLKSLPRFICAAALRVRWE